MGEEMKKIFIIGNGFDIKHHLKTTYQDFACFLYKENPDVYLNFDSIVTNQYGEDTISRKTAIDTLWKVLKDSMVGDDWNNFEENLGNLDFDSIDDGVEVIQEKDRITGELDINHSMTDENYGSVYEVPLLAFNDWLPKIFSEWLMNVEEEKFPKPIDNIKKYIDEETFFINFNYTHTLENVYGVDSKHILHIHGVIDDIDKIILGHAKLKDSASNKYVNYYINREESQKKIIKRLEKNTTQGIKNLHDFIHDNKLYDVTQVIISGHSVSDVDMQYFCELVNELNNKNLELLIDKYNYKEIKDKLEKNTKCDFNYKIRAICLG